MTRVLRDGNEIAFGGWAPSQSDAERREFCHILRFLICDSCILLMNSERLYLPFPRWWTTNRRFFRRLWDH